MSKNINNLVGTIIFSNRVRYNDNTKEMHNYFIQVSVKYIDKDGNKKEWEYSFNAKQFGLRVNSPLFEKGDRVRISGFDKDNLYKTDEGEWVNEPYFMINKIDYAE